LGRRRPVRLRTQSGVLVRILGRTAQGVLPATMTPAVARKSEGQGLRWGGTLSGRCARGARRDARLASRAMTGVSKQRQIRPPSVLRELQFLEKPGLDAANLIAGQTDRTPGSPPPRPGRASFLPRRRRRPNTGSKRGRDC
jgi:hypothetical protein